MFSALAVGYIIFEKKSGVVFLSLEWREVEERLVVVLGLWGRRLGWILSSRENMGTVSSA